MTDHAQLLREIVARESGSTWTELEEILRAIAGDDAEMNRRMREEFACIPVLTQPEICRYYATSKTWLMQTYGNGHGALLSLARGEKPALPAWAAEFEKHLPIGASILDFGGGFMKDSWFFIPRGHRVILAEIEGPVVRIVRAFMETIGQKGVAVLPVCDEEPALGRYDGIICFETLEHVKNPVALTRKLVDVLPPGGPFAMSVTFGAPEHAPYHLAENARFGDPGVWSKEIGEMGLEPLWTDERSSMAVWRRRR